MLFSCVIIRHMEAKNKSFMWSPWHGCHKVSPGCQNCYVEYLDKQFKKDSSIVSRNITNFNMPIRLNRNRQYTIPAGSEVATCFTSDFFIEEADLWREDAWKIIRERPDLHFLIPTKRLNRFLQSVPKDWNNGYDNVSIAVSVENQILADKRVPILLSLPIKHRQIFVAPILENIDIEEYLSTGQIEKVSVSGESYDNARVCNFDWVLSLKEQCVRQNVEFCFHQTGSNFVKDGKTYKINHYKEYEQAKKANIDYKRTY